MQLDPSSFDDLFPSENGGGGIGGLEDRAFNVENELLRVFDSFGEVSKDKSSSRSCVDCDNIKHRVPISEENHAYPCKDANSFVPLSPPEKWPQRPVLLCPSPESGMRIRGIRYSSHKTYLPLPGTGCGCTLPINNGLEKPGECLVIDFESDLFIGTAMIRIRNVCDPLNLSDELDPSNDKTGQADYSSYFHNKKRTFQGVVRGRFKFPEIPMSECVTGQVFNHPAGHLPPRIIMKGAISIISHLAPQLQARLDGKRPQFLSPLVSTAQSAISCQIDGTQDYEGASESIEAEMSEPQPSDQSSLIQELLHSSDKVATGTSKIPPDSNNVKTRIKIRKKTFDKLYSSRRKRPTFDPNSEYTFEFFQHLLLFDEFALNFAKPVGKHPLHRMLNGQPLKFMAAHQIAAGEEMRCLWSFDVWHESLYEDAKFHKRSSEID